MARGRTRRQEVDAVTPARRLQGVANGAQEAQLAQVINQGLLDSAYKPVWLAETQVHFLEAQGANFGMNVQEYLTVILCHAQDYPDEIKEYVRGILNGGAPFRQRT